MASNQAGGGGGGVTGGGGSGGFDMNKLLKPSSNPMNMIPNSTNLTTSPSFPSPSSVSSPSPYLTPSSSYPPPTGPYPPYHYYPSPPPPQHQLFQQQQQQQQQNRPQILYPQQIPQPPSPSHNPNPNSTSSSSSGNNLLMAFFANQHQHQPPSPTLPPPSDSTVVIPSAPPVRLRSSKVPKGRHLIGNHSVYDIDVRLDGEVQPQLEVTPITKYISDPGLVLGRQIAVNRNYICYGLKLGNIRILNIITALRSLLRGHTQRVTDMAFFAEDVHLLASASVDGRFFIWNITEGPDEEDKPQILGKIVVAIQILADGDSVHPRVCWHPHKQEILMLAIGNRILKIDSNRVGKGERFSAEEPLKCPVDELINGVQLVGKHDGEITELSMCQWLTTRLASASLDGTVKIWDDRKSTPLAVLRPYDGHPVNSVTFLIGPHPQHIVLITGGPLNRELKIWASAEEEGWLLPSDIESWKCTQTLELKSSAELRLEDAFFNQVVALNRAGLFLLANAKKNAIYAIHMDYGPNPASTRMDYIAEFTVTMPILSLTGTTTDASPDGEHIVQIYCVQTQAIQQYALDLSQCLPPPLENAELEKTDSNATRAFDVANPDGSASLESSHGTKSADVGTTSLVAPILSSSTESVPIASRPEGLPSSEVSSLSENASGAETKPSALPSGNAENIHSASPPLPLSPRLSRKSSGYRSPSNGFEPSAQPNEHGGEQAVTDYLVDRRTNTSKEKMADVTSSGDNLWKGDRNSAQNDISMVPDPPVVFKHPTHLVTPSEILSTAASSSENSQFSQRMNVGEAKVQDAVVNNDAEGVEVEVKVVGETGGPKNEFNSRESHATVTEKKEKSFYSQASDLGIQMARDCCMGTYNVDGIRQASDVEAQVRPSNNGEVEEQDMSKDTPAKVGASEASMVIPQSPSPAAKGRKQKGKNSQISGTSSPSPSPYNSADSSNEPACISGAPSTDATMSQLLAMQDMLNQMMSTQKEIQKQMNSVVSAPVNKEGKRLEASLGRSIEKVVKANSDALWARFQEENAKHEKLERDRMLQITNLITNTINKDLPAILEKTLKKEIAAVGPAVARAISPTLEKSISSAIMESFQKGVGEKAVSQLEKSVSSKLETTVARQIQAQFQTSGKQALQDALRSNLETSIIPAFEMSCKAMFEQIDSTFQKGLIKHTTAIQQQFETAHSPMAIALRDAINSATSITQTLSGELADGQRKLLAMAAAGANTKTGTSLVTQSSNGPLAGLHEMVEAPLDPTKELSRLIAERKYEEAFTGALHRSDVSIVSWLCSQVDLPGILSTVPLPLSQGVLLALLQQLACDISKETPRKLAWMTDVAVAINPADPMISMHVRPIFEQVYQILGHQRNLPSTSASEANSIRLLMHVINSVLMSCK